MEDITSRQSLINGAFKELNLADAIRNSGGVDEAQHGYENIIKVCEGNRVTAEHPYLKAVLNLAGLFSNKGKLEEAKDLLHGKRQIEPVFEEQFEYHEDLGRIEQGLGNTEAAKFSYKRAVDIGRQRGNERLSLVVLPLCDILEQEGNFKEAYKVLRDNLPYISG